MVDANDLLRWLSTPESRGRSFEIEQLIDGSSLANTTRTALGTQAGAPSGGNEAVTAIESTTDGVVAAAKSVEAQLSTLGGVTSGIVEQITKQNVGATASDLIGVATLGTSGRSGAASFIPGAGLAGSIGRLLSGLFGGGGAQDDAKLQRTPFERAIAEDVREAIGPGGGRGYAVDYQFDGTPRRITEEERAPQRVEINIQALDARSLLERKEEIAEAVRQAVLISGGGGGVLFDR